uniref:Putative ectomycorrhiza-regulated small secreted protein n=1 Tax=Moniliophthora roreri TaxID=221103 RepID=A0A0W0G9M2_MONRR
MINKIHPLLEHQPFDLESKGGHCCPLLWDLREHPANANAFSPQHQQRTLSRRVLSIFATEPPVTRLQILCEVFPSPWLIDVRNRKGVTIGDVLESLYACLSTQYGGEEFNTLCTKQQARVLDVFHGRARASANPQRTWGAGMKRVDCLLQHTVFGGLSILPTSSRSATDVCILSLRRPQSSQVWDVR